MAPLGLGEMREVVEKRVFECIANNDVDELKTLLLDLQGDIFDEHGMTPLQHAAYKGNKEMVQLLLDQGADVNSGRHKHGYSALHFAVLSGNAGVCQLLLSAGAKSHATNSVGKTPSEMAAFVGNHHCVAIINNFIPRSEIDYFTVIRGLEKEPKLPVAFADPLHKFAMQVNMHPVRVALNLQPGGLVAALDQAQAVLALMSDRQMRRSHANELISFKLHYLATVVAEVAKCRQVERDKPSDPVEAFARKVLRSVRGREYTERFVRDCVREFPHRECTIFRQMVSVLAQPDAPPAVSVVSSIVCPRLFSEDDSNSCATCGEDAASKKCSKCKATQYCDRNCQRLHWFVHKKECLRISTASTKEDSTTSTKEESTASTVEEDSAASSKEDSK